MRRRSLPVDRCLVEGTPIRLMVVDPTDNQALKIATNRFAKHDDPEILRREIQHTLDNLKSLVTQDPTGKNFQVRLLPSAPPYGIWLLDADSPRAEIRVNMYSFQGESEPIFHLLPHRDGQWFAFFQGQFEAMWNASRAWRPNSTEGASGDK